MTRSRTSPLEAHLGFWLRFVSNQVSARFEALLAQEDVSATEWVAMRTLFDAPGATHDHLIAVLGMTKGAVSKIMTKLESKGLAQRRLSGDDARQQLLVLTARGHRLVPKLAARADENDAFFFGHLDEAARAQLMQTLRALVDHHQLKQVPTK